MAVRGSRTGSRSGTSQRETCAREQAKGRREAGLSSMLSGFQDWFGIFNEPDSGPVRWKVSEVIVHADLAGVQLEVAAVHATRDDAGEVGFAVEVTIEILALERPVRREHVF